MVPGFMKLSQDDQIVLLKAGIFIFGIFICLCFFIYISFYILFIGSFELSCLRMSRYCDVSTGQVLFGDSLMPMEAFLTPGNYIIYYTWFYVY